MTLGLMDTCRYVGKVFDIIATEKSLPFSPQHYGVVPELHPTAIRGFFCEYIFTNKNFVLNEFSIYSKEKNIIVSGKKPLHRQGFLSDFITYRDLNLKMDYSGGIIIGKNFLKDYYYILGKQNPLAFNIVYELIIEGGKIIKTIDKSEDVNELRKEKLTCDKKSLESFIKEEFQNKYDF